MSPGMFDGVGSAIFAMVFMFVPVRTCTRTDVGPVGAPYWIVECVEE